MIQTCGYGDTGTNRSKIQADDDRSVAMSIHLVRGLDRLCRLWPAIKAAGGTGDVTLNGLLAGMVREHQRHQSLVRDPVELELRYGWHGGRRDD